MCAEVAVVLDSIRNDIEYIVTNTEFCFDELYHVFAFERVDPYTVLHTDKASYPERIGESGARGAFALGDVEYEHAPPLVPCARTLYIERGEFVCAKHFFSPVSEAHPTVLMGKETSGDESPLRSAQVFGLASRGDKTELLHS